MSKHTFELLAPGGDIDSIKAAIAAGADAIYCGLDRFNARNRATNLSLDTLKQILPVAHQNHCQIFLTLNIALLDCEIPSMVRLLEQLNRTAIDGVIIQDPGLAYILKHHFPELDVHASTQLNTHNEGQILFMKQLGTSRVNLARELNIHEIKHLAQFGHQHQMLMEVFVHGSYCIGFSGLCYMSSARNGASGNRGRCSQPCRDTYQTTDAGVDHPLNMKDNSAYLDLDQLADAGVYSLKIEGRIKKPHYVYTAVDQWRKQIDQYEQSGELSDDMTTLYKVFNRDFSAGYLHNTIGKNMFIDNPRNHSADHFVNHNNATTDEQRQQIKRWVYAQNTAIIAGVEQAIRDLDQQICNSEPVIQRRKTIPFTPIKQAANNKDKTAKTEQLCVLISSPADAVLSETCNGEVFYQLPNTIARQKEELLRLFTQFPKLIPWFPSILIGDDYTAAREMLQQLQAKVIATNNTGIAYCAYQEGIDWIAGPQLNLMNSYALKALKEEFNCVGAFISNEINQRQINKIIRPEQFRLFYSIYHPIDVMVSRQCLFQQTVGCRKTQVNKGCLPRCEKSASLINLNGCAYVIDKKCGELNHIYSNQHFLNSDILTELPDYFSDFLIDLRDIATDSRHDMDKLQMIDAFQSAIAAKDGTELQQAITATTSQQYHKGL